MTEPLDPELFERTVVDGLDGWRWGTGEEARMRRRIGHLAATLDACTGQTLGDRWVGFEAEVWPRWQAGDGRTGGSLWMWGVNAAVLTGTVQPGWELASRIRIAQWVDRLPTTHRLRAGSDVLRRALAEVAWIGDGARDRALGLGLRLMVVHDLDDVTAFTNQHLATAGGDAAKGTDALDAALCTAGVFDRTPQRGASRRLRVGRRTTTELVARSDTPDRFQDVTVRYLDEYAARISDTYATLVHKQIALAHLWRYVNTFHPEVASCGQLTPEMVRGFVPYAIERARTVQRGNVEGDRTTAHAWLTDVRVFFADICTWATEPGSQFVGDAPVTIPLTRHDLVGVGFEKARRRLAARTTATVIDLEREIPNIRAFAYHTWQTALAAVEPGDDRATTVERRSFWDWAILELLLQTGLRIEEATELTTLDVLKRRLRDGRVYYLLHVKPSKFDRARVIPIGDQLAQVIAEMTRHICAFHGLDHVPAVDQWDRLEKRPLPPAPYLLQAATHPSAIGVTTIRSRLARLSEHAGARNADGTPLRLRPHDCRRAFASEHLNNDTPVHVIQALLGHASIDTVMVYAKLYPSELVDGYRKTMRSVYGAFHGDAALRNPTPEEWCAFEQACVMRDMGTHLCALPTGDHCPKGLVCLGCRHAQPKRSAIAMFRRMLTSHQHALDQGIQAGEPAGQIAARQLEVQRIRHALSRAAQLPNEVAEALEAAGSDSPPDRTERRQASGSTQVKAPGATNAD